MIPATNVRSVQTSGVMAGAEFGISVNDSAHIMTILRDTLYTDKILAVLREYSANAWDSHRTSGKADRPIKVHIPTLEQPTLSIRDYGVGMSREEIFEVYTQYGASTKREQNVAVGMLGIGSKSGFAYSDTFTVTSFHNGTKSIYSAMLDASDKGNISLLYEEPCGDEIGIEVSIPVKSSDIGEFVKKAQTLFVHFDPRPDINIAITPVRDILGKTKSGVIFSKESYDYNTLFTAVMGCVPYKIDLYQVKNFEEGIPEFMLRMNGLLFFDIGEVHVNASREELKYSDRTKRAIVDKMNSLVDEYIEEMVKVISDPTKLPWQKRIASRVLGDFGDFIPASVKKYVDYSVEFSTNIPKINMMIGGLAQDVPLFTVHEGASRNNVHDIRVHENVRFVIRDDNRSIKGFDFKYTDIIVRKGKSNPKISEIRKALDEVLAATDMTGVGITTTSVLPWKQVSTTSFKSPNAKHKQKFFVYKGVKGSSYSSNWDIVERTATADDVYVELDRFASIGSSIEYHYDEDKKMALQFGITMPEVYGYKVTLKSPSKDRTGIRYKEWRKTLAQKVADDPLFMQYCEECEWKNLSGIQHFNPARLNDFADALGKSHVLVKFMYDFNRHTKDYPVKYYEKMQVINNVESASGDLSAKFKPAHKRVEDLLQKYPILSCYSVRIDTILMDNDIKKWISYIKMVDNNKETV